MFEDKPSSSSVLDTVAGSRDLPSGLLESADSRAAVGVNGESRVSSVARNGGRATSLDVYRQSQSAEQIQTLIGTGVKTHPLVEVEKHSTRNVGADLKVCTDKWAVRHKLVHVETGVVVSM